jgi:hypothetical protein
VATAGGTAVGPAAWPSQVTWRSCGRVFDARVESRDSTYAHVFAAIMHSHTRLQAKRARAHINACMFTCATVVQELAKQRTFAALSAHKWTLLAVASSPFRAAASPGTGAAAPMVEWCRHLLNLRPTPSLSVTANGASLTLSTLQFEAGSFARQLHGLAHSLLMVLGVCHRCLLPFRCLCSAVSVRCLWSAVR